MMKNKNRRMVTAYKGPSRDKIKHFDFAKKPHDPCFLLGVAKAIICKPDLKKRNFKLTKTNMENIDGPFPMPVTHSSMADFNIMAMTTDE